MSMPMSLLLMQAAAPRLGLVLGSGLGAVAEALGIEAEVSYQEVPGLRASSVPSHAGASCWRPAECRC